MKTPVLSERSNGIYRAPANITPLRSAACAANLHWVGIDLGRARGKRALLNAFARSLKFPDTFGGNWDALTDSLQDLSWLEGRGWVVTLRGAADFAGAKSDEHEMLLEILGVVAGYWRQRNRVFIVLTDATGLPAFAGR